MNIFNVCVVALLIVVVLCMTGVMNQPNLDTHRVYPSLKEVMVDFNDSGHRFVDNARRNLPPSGPPAPASRPEAWVEFKFTNTEAETVTFTSSSFTTVTCLPGQAFTFNLLRRANGSYLGEVHITKYYHTSKKTVEVIFDPSTNAVVVK